MGAKKGDKNKQAAKAGGGPGGVKAPVKLSDEISIIPTKKNTEKKDSKPSEVIDLEDEEEIDDVVKEVTKALKVLNQRKLRLTRVRMFKASRRRIQFWLVKIILTLAESSCERTKRRELNVKIQPVFGFSRVELLSEAEVTPCWRS